MLPIYVLYVIFLSKSIFRLQLFTRLLLLIIANFILQSALINILGISNELQSQAPAYVVGIYRNVLTYDAENQPLTSRSEASTYRQCIPCYRRNI